jgi:alpha-glucosidase
VIEVAVEIRQVLEEYSGERLMIGETYLSVNRLAAYYGPNLTGVQLPFNFNLMWVDWTADAIMELIRAYEAALPPGAWPNWVLSNHDQMRMASRLGTAQARVAMVLLMTLRGTPTLYYGDELGLEDVAIPPDKLRDPFGLVSPGGVLGRDPERTPMPWNKSLKAGFTSGQPWLPLGKEHPALSVEAQECDPGSMLSLTRALLALRRRESALSLGDWTPLATTSGVLSYTRTCGDRKFLIALNLNSMSKAVQFENDFHGVIELSTSVKRAREPVYGRLDLGGDEAVIVLATAVSGRS